MGASGSPLSTRDSVPRSPRSVLPFLALFFGIGVVPVDAQSGAPSPDDLSIDRVSFLAGCWAGTMGSLDMREQWSEAEGGVMLGTTRYYRDGELADFEFAMMIEVDGVATLWPYPRGERSEHGFPLVSTGDGFVFENLEHDFPVRIVYVRDGEQGLNPRAEGPDGSGPSWMLRRVSCPTGGA